MRHPHRGVACGKEAESRSCELQRGPRGPGADRVEGGDLGAIPLDQVADRILAEGVFPNPRANEPEKK